ncbi:MAG: type II toxin-antitoxin system death-on-curing family toxin [bacterium]|nr:type II toxin-antitoxin system death-on-curing family toxin [bacterium]
MQIIYLTLEQVLLIHEDQIVRYGGSSGLRDVSLLESAIFRPQSSFGGEDLYLTIFDKASALMHSLILNHSFIDGNKRTGTASMLVFLELNEYRLHVSQKALIEIALKIESKKINMEELADWLKKNSKKY